MPAAGKPMTPYLPPTDPVRVIHADAHLLVVEKPAGLLSVPGRGADKQDCLLSRLRETWPDVVEVHRLDMSTSGLMLVARNDAMQRELHRLFRDRHVEKRYLAAVDGLIEADSGTIDLPLICDWPNRPRQMVDHSIGKPSLTHYRVLSRQTAAWVTLVELEPVTGRSHQLRVHLASLGHPILGDDLYAGAAAMRADRLLLHAARIAFTHPATGAAMNFQSAAPFFPWENSQ